MKTTKLEYGFPADNEEPFALTVVFLFDWCFPW